MYEVKKDILHSRCLVAGGGGFIGSRVVQLLLDKGSKEVVVIERHAPRSGRRHDARVRYVNVDVTNKKSVDVIKQLGKFDYVFNCIGNTDQRMPCPDPQAIFESNVQTLMYLTEAIQWEHVRGAVHIGSNAEYGSQALPHTEDKRLQPTNMYGWSKASASLYAEIMTRAGLAKWCIARPFFVYGPGKRMGLIPDFLNALPMKDVFVLSGNVTRDPIYVNDVAEGLIRLAICPRARGEAVNLCNGKEVSMKKIIEMIIYKIKRGKVVVSNNVRGGDMLQSKGSILKLKTLTGWSPGISLTEGLDRILQEYGFHTL